MIYTISLTEKAKQDIEDIAFYISENDSWEKSLYVSGEIEKAIAKLDHHPERGGYPTELLSKKVRDYRETRFSPCRIFYEIRNSTVFVVAVADGRRDMVVFLAERLGP